MFDFGIFRQIWPRAQVVLSVMVAISLAGCAGIPLGGKNTGHFLIIGIGLVSLPKEETPTAIEATKAQALGVIVSDQPGLKLGVGYSSSMVVAVPDGAGDVRVEVSDRIAGPVNITVQKADLGQHSQLHHGEGGNDHDD